MNDLATPTATIVANTIEDALSHPTTAICVMVGLGLCALLISKAMDNGYNTEVDLLEGKLKFAKATT